MVDKAEIRKALKINFDINGKMTIAEDGRVSVAGGVVLKSELSHLPVQFDIVDGRFNCNFKGLQSLQGSPAKVTSNFSCVDNKLLSLEGGPDWVGDYYDCSVNRLESLKGFPSYVEGWFICDYDPSLPLLRALVAKKGVWFKNQAEYPIAKKILNVLNQFSGQGKRGVPACMVALNNLQKELGIDIRANIKW